MINTRVGTFSGSGHVQNGNARLGEPRGNRTGIRIRRQINDKMGLVKVPGSVDRQGRTSRGVDVCQD